MCIRDRLYFYLDGIRGGLSFISKRHVKTNNKYLPDYDPNKESNYFIPVDANNLYGAGMSCGMPFKGFKWISDEEIEKLENNPFEFNSNRPLVYSTNTREGYHLEVSGYFPNEYHDLMNDLPFFPEQKKINKEQLSDYQKGFNNKSNSSKLIADLSPKDRYKVDIRHLQLAVNQGFIITKIHRGIKFLQSDFLRRYVDKLTKLRKNATNDADIALWKLLINVIYGKTIENILKREDIRFFMDKRRAVKNFSKPNFKRATIFSNDLIACHMNKTEVLFDKPIFIGFTVLE